MSTNVYSQSDTTKAPRPTIFRQHIVAKYNVGLVGIFVGAEVAVTYAAYNNIHLQASYRVYELGLSGLTVSSGPHRTGWDAYMDVKYHVPFGNTFTGWSIGPYYNYGGGMLNFKERLGFYDELFHDIYDFRRHTVGASTSFQFCFGKKKNGLLELYFGGGIPVQTYLTRRPLQHPGMPDHTSASNRYLSYALRGGLCIGYVFF